MSNIDYILKDDIIKKQRDEILDLREQNVRFKVAIMLLEKKMIEEPTPNTMYQAFEKTFLENILEIANGR